MMGKTGFLYFTHLRPGGNPLDQPINAGIKIELDGSNLVPGTGGLGNGGAIVIRGLAMHSLGTVIAFNDEAFDSNMIAGNFLGTDALGTVCLGGGSIFVDNNANNVIGGPDPADRNLIAGAI